MMHMPHHLAALSGAMPAMRRRERRLPHSPLAASALYAATLVPALFGWGVMQWLGH